MLALHRATGVIRAYQSDSSSKRPPHPLPGVPNSINRGYKEVAIDKGCSISGPALGAAFCEITTQETQPSSILTPAAGQGHV